MKKNLTLSLAIVVLGIVFWYGYAKISVESRNEGFAPAGITGVQHLGENYLISEFYVNKYGGDSITRDGGGGSVVCCVMLPLKWRPGLTVEIRWRVEDWTRVPDEETTTGHYSVAIGKKMYIAKVPIEKYDEPYDLTVHFFPKGRVRAVSTMYSVSSPLHPVLFGAREGGLAATVGWPIGEMFSQAELRELRKNEKNPWK